LRVSGAAPARLKKEAGGKADDRRRHDDDLPAPPAEMPDYRRIQKAMKLPADN
jgi:hypothetical protein